LLLQILEDHPRCPGESWQYTSLSGVGFKEHDWHGFSSRHRSWTWFPSVDWNLPSMTNTVLAAWAACLCSQQGQVQERVLLVIFPKSSKVEEHGKQDQSRRASRNHMSLSKRHLESCGYGRQNEGSYWRRE
jgi:hypothetical protein